MTDISNWEYLYKISKGDPKCTTNLMYTPLINPEKTVMCMLWDNHSPYQSGRTLSKSLIDLFLKREIEFLKKLQGYHWAPKLFEIEDNKIFIEWHKESLNHIVFGGRNLDQECSTWQEQIYQMLCDLKNINCYKMALYPHCFFLDRSNHIKTIDFYSCASMSDPFIKLEDIKEMIGGESADRFKQATTIDGTLDSRIFFKNTMLHHLNTIWPESPFDNFYRKLYEKL
jgi:hypothetical protein